MKNSTLRRIIVIFSLVIIVSPMSLSLAKGSSPTTTAIIQPDGIDDVVAEGDDFASTVLADPWDMTEITDIYNEQTKNITSSAGTNRMAVSSGLLTGTSSTSDPNLFVLHPGYEVAGIPSLGKYGKNFPIDTSKYTKLTFRMYLSSVGASDRGQVIWYSDAWLGSTGHNWGGSNFFTIKSGWHVYSIDLATIGYQEGTIDWSGSIQGLRLDPTSAAGIDIQIDWIRLTTTDTSATTYQIAFSGSSSHSTAAASFISLYSDTDTNWSNGYYSEITSLLDLSSATYYNWGTIGLPAGDYYVAGQVGTDFATMILEDSWDMATSSDIVLTNHIGSSSFSAGIWSFTITGTDPFYYPNGLEKSIDTSKFHTLSFKMTSSGNSLWIPVWFETNGTPHFYQGTSGSPQFQTVTSGTQIYSLDLSLDPNWTGNVKNLRIKPASNEGLNMSIDWVALTTGNVPAVENELAAATIYSPGKLTVNRAPILSITKPSMTSGEDYATATFGNPWDMASADDIDNTNLSSVTYTNGIMSGNTPSSTPGDPQVTLRTGGLNTQTPINADKYKYMTYRFKTTGIDGKQDTVNGWVSRILWWTQGAGIDQDTTKDIVINEGWNVYQANLNQIQLEPTSIGTGWIGTKNIFRFDHTEIASQVTPVELDCIALTAADSADTSFQIRWADFYTTTHSVDPCFVGSTLEADVSSPAQQLNNPLGTTSVDLYYDTDKDPTIKTLIASGIASGTLSYTWNTSAIPEGTYYIYLVARDNYDSIGRYSQTPVIIKRSSNLTFTQPDGVDDTVLLGSDYASNILVNPWDMSETSDVASMVNISNSSFSSGIFSGTAATGNPYIWLNIDTTSPIDSSTYSKVVFKLYSSAETQGQIFWIVDNTTTYSISPFLVSAGWHDYSFYLPSQSANWSGNVTAFRLDPVRSQDLTFKLDWMKLVAANSSSFDIQWSLSNPTGITLSLYYDTDNSGFDGNLIAANIAAGNSSSLTPAVSNQIWDTSFLDSGPYYIYAVINDGVNPTVKQYAAYPITVLKPGIAVTQPDGVSDQKSLGNDFATNVLLDAWDMSQSSDIVNTLYIPNQMTTPTFSNGIMSATTTGSDPYFYLRFDPSKPVDPSTYNKLYLRMYSSSASQFVIGWFEATTLGFHQNVQTSKAGWNTYIVDFAGNTEWSGHQIQMLRIKPAIVSGVSFQVDFVKLVQSGSSAFDILWTTSIAGSAKTALYYDTNCFGNDGSLIVSGIGSELNTYNWDISFLDDGNYYIYAIIGAGVNSTTSYGAGPITVGSAPVQNTCGATLNYVFFPIVVR